MDYSKYFGSLGGGGASGGGGGGSGDKATSSASTATGAINFGGSDGGGSVSPLVLIVGIVLSIAGLVVLAKVVGK